MIKLNHLDKYFFKNKKNEIHVIHDVNLEFPDQGLVVLLGPSGSGKTTLLNVIGGLDRIEKGEIVFDDQVINGYHANQWDDIRNEKVGYIFQNYNLLPSLTVFENIAFVLRLLGIKDEAKIQDSVYYILKAVGMYKYRKKRATQLSGGQQQRVAIARALVKNPEVVIADEPTGNLDSKNTLEIMKIIKEISKNKLVVLVTHEKDIAKIYGDRIIEIKDGQVVSDIENSSKMDYEHIDDNIVYLKDMYEVINHEDNQFEMKMYDEKQGAKEPVKVRLIVRNKTLYIDVDSVYQKVKLIDENSNLILKDEHYEKENQAELIDTSFDSNYLDLKDYERQSKIFVSAKQIVKLAFEKVVQSSKKGKLLLFSFIVSGIMIALAMALTTNFFVPNPAYMVYDNDYVVAYIDYTQEGSSSINYQSIRNSMAPDDFMNLLSDTGFSIVDQQNDSTFFSFNAAIDIVDNLGRQKIILGSESDSDSEIMISTALADSFFESSLYDYDPDYAQSYGIWDYEDLLKEKVLKNGEEFSISGIVKSDQKLIYISKDIYYSLLGVTITSLTNPTVTYLYNNLSDDDFIYGSNAGVDEIILSSSLVELLGYDDLLDDATVWPQEITEFGMVSGIVESDESNIWVDSETLTEKYFSRNSNLLYNPIYIHTNDAKTLIENIEANTNLVSKTENMYVLSLSLNDVSLSFMIPMIIIIFGISFVGFYFLMHSTMISRIYEISVFRSLGMKKRELFISYMVESMFITTITTLIGYILATILFGKMSSSSLGFSPFNVNFLSAVLGVVIVYGINILAGILPIMTLLRKTPSEISSKFDI
ncbi:MAG: ABC transporter ATP-binding protein/permease [Acholeplasmataceae bacterium]